MILILFHYVRYRLSYDQVAEIFWLRGFKLCGETIRLWVKHLGAKLSLLLRKKRYGKAAKSWKVDETYVKVNTIWCYLYRCIDRNGNLVDVYLSPTRDQSAAIAFFRGALNGVGHKPHTVTTDKNPAYPPAISSLFGNTVQHRSNKYLNNSLEQDHRDIKSRYRGMKGFKDFLCAAVFCNLYEEVRNLLRLPQRESINTGKRFSNFTSQFREIQKLAIAL